MIWEKCLNFKAKEVCCHLQLFGSKFLFLCGPHLLTQTPELKICFMDVAFLCIF